MDDEVLEELERREETETVRYRRFVEYGDQFIDVMDSGISNLDSKWVTGDEIFEEADTKETAFGGTENYKFSTIYNLMCDLKILEPFNNSPEYTMDTDKYDKNELIKAWEHVSGEEYGEDEDDKFRNEAVSPDLDTDELYDDLKD